MRTRTFHAIAAIAAATLSAAGAHALPLPLAQPPGVAAPLVPVAGGCGPGAWRGPWGHCRTTPYVGRLPGGWYQVRAGNGCPPGYWRGPWGHCRDTPYHGPLPGGGFR